MELMLGSTTRPWNAFSFSQACASIAAAGYPEIAVFSHEGKIPVTAETTAEEAATVAQTVREAGLKPTMLISGVRLDLPLEEAAADHRRLVDACAALGAPWLMDCGTADPSVYEKYHEVMRQSAPYAQSQGVALTMKPHGGIGLTGKMMVEVVEAVNHPNFSLCYDPGNIIYYTAGELRPETDVDDVLGHVGTCIIKDCLVSEGKPDVWILPGDGWVNFEVVLGKLVAGGFTGPLYVECVGGSELADIDDRARRTRDTIGGIIEKL
jgi:sugar phosphate isomerase/epimerase